MKHAPQNLMFEVFLIVYNLYYMPSVEHITYIVPYILTNK